eukprot:10052228-Prorocentrum_lima.AAC.1
MGKEEAETPGTRCSMVLGKVKGMRRRQLVSPGAPFRLHLCCGNSPLYFPPPCHLSSVGR